ncbi:MAG: Holliday junction resolvase RuvX, partial [Clostridia bacterium]
MKKVGLDVGDVRVGIAVSDMLCMIANARESYTLTKNDDVDFEYFTKLAKAENADTFVVGLPLSMDGTEGKRVVITRDFGERLREFSGINVVYQDERLST